MMKTAVLKDLTPAQQKRVYEYLKAEGGRKTVTFVRCQFGKQTHESSLSEFRAWYLLQLQFHSLDSMRRNFEELLLKKFPKSDPKKVQEFGQAYFTMQAASTGDHEQFCAMEKLRLAKEKEARESSRLTFDREKYETETCETFIKWMADAKARKIAESSISNAEKIAALRKTFFQDVDALEKSGAVVLPAA